jgi:hypothetical protein
MKKLTRVEFCSWGVRKGDTSLILGYEEGNNFDLGVREYQKVENSWFNQMQRQLRVDLKKEEVS